MSKQVQNRFRGRPGFTLLETSIVVGLLMTALILVAQVATWALAERSRGAARLETLEAATNILESARARAWEELTPDWAAAQRLPEPLAERTPRAKLNVKVEPEPSRPLTKRVTVEIHWIVDKGTPPGPTKLVGLFSARTAASGGKP